MSVEQEDLESVEQDLEAAKEALESVKDLMSDAESEIKAAFLNGYEAMEGFIDRAFNKLYEATQEIDKIL